jgi:hypothetical protein
MAVIEPDNIHTPNPAPVVPSQPLVTAANYASLSAYFQRDNIGRSLCLTASSVIFVGLTNILWFDENVSFIVYHIARWASIFFTLCLYERVKYDLQKRGMIKR